jgi:hypothetical protein
MSRRPIALNTSSKTANSVKKNQIEIGLALDNYKSNPGGLTWYNGPDSTNQYVIYSDSFSLGLSTLANSKPICWSTGDLTNASLLNVVNKLPTRSNQIAFTTAEQALQWLAASTVFNLVGGTLDNVVTNGLIIYLDASQKGSYPGIGNVWYDLSGANNNATMYNGVTYNTGGWMDFDGSNDYCEIAYNSASMDLWKMEQTVSVWVYHTNTTGRRNIWDQAYGGYGTWTHEAGLNINYYYGNAGSNTTPYTSRNSGDTPRGVWNNITIARSLTTVSWYINGVLINSGSNSYGVLTTTPQRVQLGTGYAGYWQGRMGSVMAYSRGLTASEVLQNYNASKTKYGL